MRLRPWAVSQVVGGPPFTRSTFIDTLRVTRLEPCGMKDPRLRCSAPMMGGRETGNAFESGSELGGEESSESSVNNSPAPPALLDDISFASLETSGMGKALTELVFSATAGGGGTGAVELLEVKGGRTGGDWKASTEPGGDMEVAEEGRLGMRAADRDVPSEMVVSVIGASEMGLVDGILS